VKVAAATGNATRTLEIAYRDNPRHPGAPNTGDMAKKGEGLFNSTFMTQ